ncbi:hypothetical protein HF086_003814 [Spodoptera exigua]|uniref:Choline transporter-like protein n=1 Tax=Spodoptera exigua TaxID=7107 RepID=A0A922SNM3_SPOEX|nr:hypothetical protein HF086_003814 [Spodoptera exigua]
MGCTQSEISPQNETPRKGCTDVLWLIIYILFWILMIIVAAISFVYGNPLRVINGFDSFGNTCGVKSNYKLTAAPVSGISTIDKKYLFFMDVKELQRSLKICVKECPNKKLESMADIQNFYKETGSNLCRYDINLNSLASNRDVSNNYIGPCPTLPVYETFPLLNRCFPKSAKELTKKVFNDFYDLLNSWDTIEQMLSDLYSSWKEMIICVIIAFICSLIMVSILHLLATLVSWIFMILVSIASVAGTALLWYTYYELKNKHKTFETAYLSESLKNESAFLWYSIIATIITVILLLLVFVMRSRVSFLAALFRETAHCLGSIPALFLQPIITFFILVLFLAFWSIVVVCLATANYPGIPLQTNFLINGSTTTEIDSLNKPAIDTHNGNSTLKSKLSARAEKGSECAKCGLKCGICCFYCLEKFIRYLNHNAYTIITIERCHFCKAAGKAFSTIVNNALQVATINSVGDFILFLGKCIVTAVTGIIGLLLLKRNSDLHFFAVPTLVICIYSFFIAHCILSLYEMVVDSLFLCVCEDRNMNGNDGRWKNTRLAELGGHKGDKYDEQDGAELQDVPDKY